MDIRPLHTEDDYRAALAEVSALVDLDPEAGTPDGDRLEILSTLVERYESSMDTAAYLRRSPANVAHLERSIAQLRAGNAPLSPSKTHEAARRLSLADALAMPLDEAQFEFEPPRLEVQFKTDEATTDLGALKGIVRKPEHPVSVEDMDPATERLRGRVLGYDNPTDPVWPADDES